MLMNKATAIRAAQERGLAIYRSDTLSTIAARIEADIKAQAERCHPVRCAVALLARLGHARPVQRRSQRQLWLPIRLPHDLRAVCGMVA